MEELVLDKSGSRPWMNVYRVTRNLSILHIQGNPDSGIWEILVETGPESGIFFLWNLES